MQKLQTVVGSFSVASSVAKALEHVRTPLYRNAYAWMFSTGLSSGLGIVYWLVAARLYPDEVVGVNAALVNSMMFLASVSLLDLMSAMVRFIPNAGQNTRRLVLSAYGASLGMATLVGALLFIAVAAFGAERWNALNLFPFDVRLGLWFVLSMGIWCVFTLQDSVLTGLRDAVWVPVENTIYAIAKLILLVILAKVTPQYGIYISWMLPVAVLILPMNWLIFRRVIPRHVQEAAAHEKPFQLREIVRYIIGNYVGWLFSLSSTRLLPVLVAFWAGASANAYFNLAWQIANSLKLIFTHMIMSLTVEGARSEEDFGTRIVQFLRTLLLLAAPAVLVGVVGSPLVLRLSGSNYVESGSAVLRLMLIAVIPAMITLVYIGVARVKRRVGGIALVQGILSALVLVLSYVLIPRAGIAGVGLALLISETLVAAGILITWATARARLAPPQFGEETAV